MSALSRPRQMQLDFFIRLCLISRDNLLSLGNDLCEQGVDVFVLPPSPPHATSRQARTRRCVMEAASLPTYPFPAQSSLVSISAC